MPTYCRRLGQGVRLPPRKRLGVLKDLYIMFKLLSQPVSEVRALAELGRLSHHGPGVCASSHRTIVEVLPAEFSGCDLQPSACTTHKQPLTQTGCKLSCKAAERRPTAERNREVDTETHACRHNTEV